jgi:hypothetical protein
MMRIHQPRGLGFPTKMRPTEGSWPTDSINYRIELERQRRAEEATLAGSRSHRRGG